MIPLLPRETSLPRIVHAINQLVTGRSNAAGQVTLNAGATTTVVTSEVISALSYPQLTAGPGTWTSTALRVSSLADGTFTITHSNEAATDRVVYWHAVGG